MSWLSRVARFLGLQTPPPPALVELRRYADELAAAALDLRNTALRAVLLEQRVSGLEREFGLWEKRFERAQRRGDPDLVAVTARIVGRVEGQLQFARAELGHELNEEIELRRALIDRRRHWFGLIRTAEEIGLDVSGCLLEIDLTRPVPDPVDPEEDPEREFVARLIDGAALH